MPAILTREEIIALIVANIVENGNFGITPAMLSEILTAIANSYSHQADTATNVEFGSLNITSPETGLMMAGTRVLAGQGDAIALTGDQTPVGQAVDAVINCLRTHGLINPNPPM